MLHVLSISLYAGILYMAFRRLRLITDNFTPPLIFRILDGVTYFTLCALAAVIPCASLILRYSISFEVSTLLWIAFTICQLLALNFLNNPYYFLKKRERKPKNK